MAFNEGDFIEVEYTAWNDINNSVLSTTYEDVAKKENMYDEHIKYGRVLVVIGSNAVVKGLEKELKNMDVGGTKKFVLEPEEAFGNRDENLVKVMKLSDLKSHNINPYPGMRLNIDNTLVTIKSVGSGRVVVDANHPDAGKKIRYEVRVTKFLNEEKDKINALARTYDLSPTSIGIDGSTVEMYYDSSVKKDSDYFINKTSSLAAIFTYMKNVDKMVVKEEYVRERKDKVEKDKVNGSD